MYQRPIQSVNSFKSYRTNKLKSTDIQTYRQADRQTHRHTDRHTDIQTDTQTDTFAKTIFSGSEGLKMWTFDKNGEGVTFGINLIPSLMRM